MRELDPRSILERPPVQASRERIDRRQRRRFDRVDVLTPDRFELGFGRADHVETPCENGFHRRAALHRGGGHFLNLPENFMAAQATKFIDAFNRRKRGIAVKEKQSRSHAFS